MSQGSKRTEKAVHIFMPATWHRWLKDRAHAEDVSIAELVRRALAAHYPDLPSAPAPPDAGE